MAKDPAFLFYSKDWIEGTAEMFPAEKGVYIDLLCYQHQKGDLPTDIERLARLVRLTTIEFLPIWENIKDKFELDGNRMVNRKLDRVMGERSEKGIRNFISGTFAALLRVNKLSRKNYDIIRKEFKIDNFIDKDRERITERLTEWFNLRLKSIENENAIVNENEDINIIKEEEEIENQKKLKKVLFKDFNSIPIPLNENGKLYNQIAFAYYETISKNMDELNLPKNLLEKSNALEWIKTVRLMIENKEATIQDFRDVRNYLLSPNCWWKGKILSLPAARGEKWLKLVSSMRSDVKGGKLKKPMEQQMQEATDYLQRLENVLNS